MQGNDWRFCLPVLLGISCINCGTTSLGAYLDGHAHLSVGTKKEHKFFVMKCSDARNGKDYECDRLAYTMEFPSLPKGCSWNQISGQASGMRRNFDKVRARLPEPTLELTSAATLLGRPSFTAACRTAFLFVLLFVVSPQRTLDLWQTVLRWRWRKSFVDDLRLTDRLVVWPRPRHLLTPTTTNKYARHTHAAYMFRRLRT